DADTHTRGVRVGEPVVNQRDDAAVRRDQLDVQLRQVLVGQGQRDVQVRQRREAGITDVDVDRNVSDTDDVRRPAARVGGIDDSDRRPAGGNARKPETNAARQRADRNGTVPGVSVLQVVGAEVIPYERDQAAGYAAIRSTLTDRQARRAVALAAEVGEAEP